MTVLIWETLYQLISDLDKTHFVASADFGWKLLNRIVIGGIIEIQVTMIEGNSSNKHSVKASKQR